MERQTADRPKRGTSPEAGTVLDRSSDPDSTPGIRVVAVGASAGGAEAFAELFAGLPSNTGLAFVVIQHLDASHGSMLAGLLQKSTTIPVQEAADGTTVAADRVYVIPPDRELSIRGARLHLKARPAKVPHRPIDRFFMSLAREQSSRAVGVVLSGNDSDGAAGLQAIRDSAGITFAQDASALYGVMPLAAAPAADFVLRPADIAAHLVRIAAGGSAAAIDVDGSRFDSVLALIKERFGVDFSPYKKPSIHRRILRRMLLDGINTIEEYADVLASSDQQLATLHQDLLIGVTTFFREPKHFELLRTDILPKLLAEGRSDPLRVWVAGCSSGEEVYSVAIAVLEALGERQFPVTVFGTDINTTALDVARTGIYSERQLVDVSAARRERFFTAAPGGLRVSKRVRELCIFARHDVTRDPPYSNIDLLTCCNVLIYFGSELQERALGAMHYALAPEGVLMLGSAETLRRSTLFAAAQPTAPFYRKVTNVRQWPAAVPNPAGAPRAGSASARPARIGAEPNADLVLVEHLAPCGVLVNETGDIARLRGDVDPYVRLSPGEANMNLFHLLRHPELLAELRPALRRATEGDDVVRVDGVVALAEDDHRSISVEIVPVRQDTGPALYWIPFRHVELPARAADGAGSPVEEEAASLRHALTAAVEERERLAGEASAAAEEAQSSDEELRSANEELETAKEELQSANEELLTLNSELLSRNTSLMTMNDDLQNVLSTIEIPMVFVGVDGNIRRFNAQAATLFGFDNDSIGRPLSGARRINGETEIAALVDEVIAERAANDVEVRDQNGRWRLLRVRPYRMSDGTVDGAILAVVDIDTLKRNVLAAEKSARLSALLAHAGALLASSLDYESTLELLTRLAVPDFADWCSVDLLADDGSIRHLAVSHANPFMRELAATFQELTWGGDGVTAPRHPSFRESVLVSEVHPAELTAGGGGETRYAQLVGALGLKSLIRAPLKSRDRTFGTMTFSISDHTYSEEDLHFANELARQAAMAIDTALLFREAEAANRYLHALLGTVAHEIRTPLTAILGWAQLATEVPLGEATTAQALLQIEQSAKLVKVFIDDLLDTERIKMRKLRIEKEEVDLKTITETAAEMMKKSAEGKQIALHVDAGEEPVPYEGDHGRLLQVVWNLVSNAVKFTPAGGQVRVVLTSDEGGARLTVSDSGVGIAESALTCIFDIFNQAGAGAERTAGLGLGLAIVKEVVTLHGGSVDAKSDGKGKGSTFNVLLPFEPRGGGHRRKTRRKAAPP